MGKTATSRTAPVNEGSRKLCGKIGTVVCGLGHRVAREDDGKESRFILRDAEVALDMAEFIRHRLHGIPTKTRLSVAQLSLCLLGRSTAAMR